MAVHPDIHDGILVEAVVRANHVTVIGRDEQAIRAIEINPTPVSARFCLQQAKAHQDQRQAKEEEARTTFATLAAANAKGDYSGAHSAAVAYAALAEEVKNLKDNEYAAKERILARAV